jgi:hypothetical protein
MKFTLIGLLGILMTLCAVKAGIGDDALRRRLRDLRDDRKERNCGDAMDVLEKDIEDPKVRDAVLSELYATKDLQVKEACLVLLCRSRSFEPDEQFMRTLLSRMQYWGPPGETCCTPAGTEGALFLVAQVPKYADLIASELKDGFSVRDNSLWYQYVLIRALAKGRVIDHYADRFTPEYLNTLAQNLQDDKVMGNAAVAASAFLLLGKIGLPVLHTVPRASDLQGREFARKLLAYSAGELSREDFAKTYNQEGEAGLWRDQLQDSDPLNDVNQNVLVGPIPTHPDARQRRRMKELFGPGYNTSDDLSAEIAEADRRLNVVYQKLRAKLNSSEKHALKEEELAWIKVKESFPEGSHERLNTLKSRITELERRLGN